MKKVYIPYVNPLNKMDVLLDIVRDMLDAEDDIEFVELDVADEKPEEYLAPLQKGVDGILFGPGNVLGELMNTSWKLIEELDTMEKGRETPEIVCGAFGIYDFFGEGVSFLMNRLKSMRVQMVGKGVCVQWDPNAKDIQKVKNYIAEFIEAVRARPEA